MTASDPGRVLRLALTGWGLGHVALGRTTTGAILIAAELVSAAVIVWLGIGLADTSAYLVPFLAGVVFLVIWAGQAVAAYRGARAGLPEAAGAPPKSPALAVGWLSVPLLVWGAGYWVAAGGASTPAAVLDRFVTAWSDDRLSTDAWPALVVDRAEEAAAGLGVAPDRLRDVRFRIASHTADRATAVAEAIHYERRETRVLWIFAGSELVPVADRQLLALELEARPATLPGGGDVGAVRWEIVAAGP